MFGPVGRAVLPTPLYGCSQAVDSIYSALSHLLSSKSEREVIPPSLELCVYLKRSALCDLKRSAELLFQKYICLFSALAAFFALVVQGP